MRDAPRERRTLLVGLTIIGLLVGVRATPAITRRYREMLEADRAIIREADEAEAAVRALPRLRDSLATRRQRLTELDSAALDGHSRNENEVQLAAMLSDAAELAHAQVGAVQLVAPADSSARREFSPVALRASVQGTLQSIVTLLSLLEQGPTLAAVRELSIAASDGQTTGGSAGIRAEIRLEALAANSGMPKPPIDK